MRSTAQTVVNPVQSGATIGLLSVTGVPVFRDGLNLSIPAGAFVVAEACSGVRFQRGSGDLIDRTFFPGAPLPTALDWSPNHPHAADSERLMLDADSAIELFIAWYPRRVSVAELIGWQNQIYDSRHWQLRRDERVRISDSGGRFDATLMSIASVDGTNRWVVSWYELPANRESSATKAKLRQAFNLLLGRSSAGAIVVLTAPYLGPGEAERRELLSVAGRYAATIRSALPFAGACSTTPTKARPAAASI